MDKATTGNINVIKTVDRDIDKKRNWSTMENGIDDRIDKSKSLMPLSGGRGAQFGTWLIRNGQGNYGKNTRN